MDDEHTHDDGEDNTDHDHHSHDADTVSIAVVTVSSSRTLEDDPGGDVVETALSEAGHEVTDRVVVIDDRVAIADAVTTALEDGADVVVTTGGTGLTPDDVTVDAVDPLFDRGIPGFGELFRYVSYEEVGPMAMASRATAGVVADRLVFCLPGSENAARTGSEQLVAPAVGHLLGLVRR
jgi:molybdenum cofactor biosynthesis protein B